LELHVEKIPSL